MQVRIANALCGISIALICAQSFAQKPTMDSGNYWYEKCNSANIDDRLQCASFVNGVVGGFIGHAKATKTLNFICIPLNVTFGQMGDVFAKYLNEHPATRNQDASSMAILSLWEAFSCT